MARDGNAVEAISVIINAFAVSNQRKSICIPAALGIIATEEAQRFRYLVYFCEEMPNLSLSLSLSLSRNITETLRFLFLAGRFATLLVRLTSTIPVAL